MPAKPTSVNRKASAVLSAWAKHAPNESFGKMTLTQFKNKVQPCVDCHDDIVSLEAQIKAAYSGRALTDADARQTVALVVNSVKGSPDFGEDSVLYEAMGYKRRSERHSGLTRRKRAAASGKNAA